MRDVRFVETYRRRLRTRRFLVFENVFDLEHVCVLHRRWFRDLRPIVRRPDYVEYRLQSRFYGLRQEIVARGAPVDGDRYWYEFNGRLARIRVEGRMEGPDGDLTLTETITYRFAWPLVPLFFALRPLFRRQKRDILEADSRLLEREYALEREGFQRLPDAPPRPRVVVFGGSGFFGSLVVGDLLLHTNAEIVVASRRPRRPRFSSEPDRVRTVRADLRDRGSLLPALEGAEVAIGCVGPYQGLPESLLRACVERKVHYVDAADDRDFVERCQALANETARAGIAAFVGCSVVPGISSLLTRYALEGGARPETVRIFITPGTRHPRGPGSFLCLLSTVGEEFEIPFEGGTRKVRGWTGRERIEFPPPLGRRFVYFVVDVADYFVQPRYFGTPTVEFKIGSELDALNRCLGGLRLLKEGLGLRGLDALVPILRPAIALASPFGTSRGGVMVEVTAREDGSLRRRRLSVLADRRGEVIPAILPSLATQAILRGEVPFRGIVPLSGWLARDRFEAELRERGVRLVAGEDRIDG